MKKIIGTLLITVLIGLGSSKEAYARTTCIGGIVNYLAEDLEYMAVDTRDRKRSLIIAKAGQYRLNISCEDSGVTSSSEFFYLIKLNNQDIIAELRSGTQHTGGKNIWAILENSDFYNGTSDEYPMKEHMIYLPNDTAYEDCYSEKDIINGTILFAKVIVKDCSTSKKSSNYQLELTCITKTEVANLLPPGTKITTVNPIPPENYVAC
jgi:hypothetical protein